jgi:hypothetical protein
MHLLHVIDGPDMDGQASTMGLSNETTVDKGNLSSVGRNLKTVAFGDLPSQSEARSPQPSDTLGAHGRAYLGAEKRPEMIEPSI